MPPALTYETATQFVVLVHSSMHDASVGWLTTGPTPAPLLSK